MTTLERINVTRSNREQVNQIIDALTGVTTVDFEALGALTHSGDLATALFNQSNGSMSNLLGLNNEGSYRMIGLQRGNPSTVEAATPLFNMRVQGAFNTVDQAIAASHFMVRAQIEGSGDDFATAIGNAPANYLGHFVIHDNSSYTGAYGGVTNGTHDSAALVATARSLRANPSGIYGGTVDSEASIFALYLQTEIMSPNSQGANEILFSNTTNLVAPDHDATTAAGKIYGLNLVSRVNLSEVRASSSKTTAGILFTALDNDAVNSMRRGIIFGLNSLSDMGIDFSGSVAGTQYHGSAIIPIRLQNQGYINSRNAAGTANVQIIGLDSSDQVLIRNAPVFFQSTNGTANLLHIDANGLLCFDNVTANSQILGAGAVAAGAIGNVPTGFTGVFMGWLKFKNNSGVTFVVPGYL